MLGFKEKRVTRSSIIFTQYAKFSQHDMAQFKKEIISDLNTVLNEIFCPPFLRLLGREKEQLFKINQEDGLLTYVVKDEDLYEYMSLINLIFIKLRMSLEKVELNQEYYYNQWKKHEWTLVSEFKDQWFYHFFLKDLQQLENKHQK